MLESSTTNSSFVMHGARAVVKLARRPEFFERQVFALEEAVAKQPALAIDIAKALLETTCKTILTDRQNTFDSTWEMPKLVKEALGCLKLAPDHLQNQDAVQRSLRQMGGSLQGTVQAICEVRNNEGFASHGRDGYVQTIDVIHAEFVARSADAVISFLYNVHSGERGSHRVPQYEDEAEFNAWLDDQSDVVVIAYGESEERVTLEYPASEVLFNVDATGYQDAFQTFKNISS